MIDTPTVVVDKQIMMSNIKKMNTIASKNKVELRPHAKTHKIPWIASQQIKAGAKGIAVAKLAEAEVMAENGIEDIFIAYPIVSNQKINRLLELNNKIRLIVGVDSLQGVKSLAEAAGQNNQVIEIRMEIDTGLRRTGVKYDQAVDLANNISRLPNINLTGIYTFKGAVFEGKPTMDLQKAGFEEGKLLVSIANKLREKGIDIKDVSAGSTPTAKYVSQVEGITEIRPGTYVFNDRMQAEYGVCNYDECAAKVVAGVVSVPDDDYLVIDGGSKSLATDVIPNTAPLKLKGYGLVLNNPEAIIDRLTEEHGMVNNPASHDFQIGDHLEVIPNHICSTVNLYNSIFLKDENGKLESYTVKCRGMLV